MALLFKVCFSIRTKDDDKSVYQKQDGERFSQRRTIKLNVNTGYVLKIVIRPPVRLMELAIMGERIEFEEMKQVKPDDDDDEAITYVSDFSTVGYELSKRQKRKDIPITLTFERGHMFMVTLQCKFYKEHEVEHCHWGQVLSWLEYDCKAEEGSTHVDILNEKHL